MLTKSLYQQQGIQLGVLQQIPRLYDGTQDDTVQLTAIQQNTKPQCQSLLLLDVTTTVKTGHFLTL